MYAKLAGSAEKLPLYLLVGHTCRAQSGVGSLASSRMEIKCELQRVKTEFIEECK